MAKIVIRYSKHELLAKHCYIPIYPKFIKKDLYGLVVPTESKNILAWADIYTGDDKDEVSFARITEYPVDVQFVEVVEQRAWNLIKNDTQVLAKQSIIDSWEVVDYKYAYTKTGEPRLTYNAENRISKIRTDYKYAMQVKTREV